MGHAATRRSREYLVPQQLLQVLGGEHVLVVVEGEELAVDGRSLRLVTWVVVRRQVRVCERLRGSDPLARVEHEHPAQQVESQRADWIVAASLAAVGQPGRPVLGRAVLRQRGDVLAGARGVDAGELGRGVAAVAAGPGRANQIEDQQQLVAVVAAGEQRPAREQLGEDAAARPHVHRLRVLRGGQHHLGRTVPSRGDVLGHGPAAAVAAVLSGVRTRPGVHVLGNPGKTEVAYLQVAVRVDQQVGGLQVAVDHVGSVDHLQPAQRLVDEVLDVVVRQVLCLDHTVQVRLHQLLDNVHLVEVVKRVRSLDVEDRDDVLVLEVLQDLDLPQRPQRKQRLRKGLDLLDGNDLARRLVHRGTHNPISALSQQRLQLEITRYIEHNLLAHVYVYLLVLLSYCTMAYSPFNYASTHSYIYVPLVYSIFVITPNKILPI